MKYKNKILLKLQKKKPFRLVTAIRAPRVYSRKISQERKAFTLHTHTHKNVSFKTAKNWQKSTVCYFKYKTYHSKI